MGVTISECMVVGTRGQSELGKESEAIKDSRCIHLLIEQLIGSHFLAFGSLKVGK